MAGAVELARHNELRYCGESILFTFGLFSKDFPNRRDNRYFILYRSFEYSGERIEGVSIDLSISFAIRPAWNLIIALHSPDCMNIFRPNEIFVFTLGIE
jgi:hypothetical protein